MSMSAETDQFENSLKVIRKLRKKLRQIERLESTKRDLTPEESMKVIRTEAIISHLLQYNCSSQRDIYVFQ